MLSIKEIKSKMETGKVVTGVKFPNHLAYDLIMDNALEINKRKYAAIPLELLEIDETYQRVNCISMDKVSNLAREFDENMCDPILVSPHPETCTFAVIDGGHRMLASEVLKRSNICAVFAEGLPKEPEARRKAEAELFCKQNENIDRMTQAHKHKANVCRGIKNYIVLDECIKGRRLLLNIHELRNLSEDKQNELKAMDYKVLSGYCAALKTAGHIKGKEVLNAVLDIIEETAWHDAANGYTTNNIKVLSSMMNLYDIDPVVKQAVINVLTPVEPKVFIAKAIAKYPGRKTPESMLMYLDQEVATLLKREPKYTGGDLRKLTNVLNKKRAMENASDKTTPFPATGTEVH